MKGLRTRTSKYTPEQRSERRRKRNILKKEIYDRQQTRQLAFFVACVLLYILYRVMRILYKWF